VPLLNKIINLYKKNLTGPKLLNGSVHNPQNWVSYTATCKSTKREGEKKENEELMINSRFHNKM